MIITDDNLGETRQEALAYRDVHLTIIMENIEDLSRIF
jgi:hypothetical protein